MDFREKIQSYIESKELFWADSKLLVALSGGADSVALLRVLLDLEYPCEAAHCNFHLRGEESDRDEMFVRQLCEKFSVKLHVTHFETEKYAKEQQISIEMAARDLRYQWFDELMRADKNIDYTVVAHHRDDNVETMLINLIRGTGIDGLTGIPYKNARIARPLLEVSREDILEYLKDLGQDYITDSTNLKDDFLRNKIRLNVIPMLEELNPSIRKTLADNVRHLTGVAEVYHEAIELELERTVEEVSDDEMHVSIREILASYSPETILYEWLYPLGFNPTQIGDIHQSMRIKQPGKRFFSKDWEVLRDRDLLMVRKREHARTVPKLEMNIVEVTPTFVIPTDKNIACLDADKVKMPFEIRKWEWGDTFIPLGMKGKKNVCKYMTDQKFSLYQKERQYVMVSEDKVAWLIGERIDNRFRISEKTKRALIVRVK